MAKLNARRQELERQKQEMERHGREAAQAADVLKHLEAFCQKVSAGLQVMTFEERQKLLRLLIDRIVIDGQQVRIEGVLPIGEAGRDVTLRPLRQ